jgi:O-antigen ligase
VIGALRHRLPARLPPVTFRHWLLAAYVFGLGASITLSQSALAVLSALWIWRLRDPAVRRRLPLPLLAPVLAFSAVTILSALVSGAAVTSLVAAKGLLLVMGLYVTVDALSDDVDPDHLVTGLVAVGAVGALVGLVQVLSCPSPPTEPGLPTRFYRCDRARGFFSIYMTQAGVLTMILLVSVPRLLPGAGRRAAAAGPWLVMVLSLAATYVRGAWLGFAAGMASLVVLARRGRGLIAVALTVLVGLALVGPDQLRHRVRSMTDPQEATIKERIYMWRSGAAMLGERPMLGVGPGGVKREYSRYALPEAVKKRTGHLHNTPLQILVERGLVGLAAWLWIWVAFYMRAGALLFRLSPEQRSARALTVGSLAAITGFLVSGLSEYNFGDSEVVLLAWTLMALPFVAARRAALARD